MLLSQVRIEDEDLVRQLRQESAELNFMLGEYYETREPRAESKCPKILPLKMSKQNVQNFMLGEYYETREPRAETGKRPNRCPSRLPKHKTHKATKTTNKQYKKERNLEYAVGYYGETLRHDDTHEKSILACILDVILILCIVYI